MIDSQLLCALFTDTYASVKRQIEGLSHPESVYQPPFGGNCANWIVGHLVVARCNFMMLLDVPSIWSMDQCRRFIPGSSPVTGADDAVPFQTLVADLERIQEQLLAALGDVAAQKLDVISGDKSVGAHLAFYHAHEAYHAGQLEFLRQMLGK